MACSPAMRITRFTTIARTGRLTNRSVNFILAVLRLGRRLVLGLSLVVDEHCRAIAQLEHSGAHDFFTWLEAREDRNLVASRGAELHELLVHSPIWIPAGVF